MSWVVNSCRGSMSLARARELAEKLRGDPAWGGLFALSIVVYDLIEYHRVAKLEQVYERCLVDRSIVDRLLRRLEELGIVELRGDEVVLTNFGRKVIELARWGRVLT